MSKSISARRLILERIRNALAAGGAERKDPPGKPYNRRGRLDPRARLALMTERLREYDAEVVECPPGSLAAEVHARLRASGRRTFLAPPEIPEEWRASEFTWNLDRDLPIAEIEACDGVLTSCFAGIADSGTIVLHHTAGEGRRVLSLLPDWHLCVLYASQVVETLPEYFDRCEHPPTLATYISGPSATADIEMTRIKGVHGPRFLNVILVNDQ